jgi:hypothetical protein
VRGGGLSRNCAISNEPTNGFAQAMVWRPLSSHRSFLVACLDLSKTDTVLSNPRFAL